MYVEGVALPWRLTVSGREQTASPAAIVRLWPPADWIPAAMQGKTPIARTPRPLAVCPVRSVPDLALRRPRGRRANWGPC